MAPIFFADGPMAPLLANLEGGRSFAANGGLFLGVQVAHSKFWITPTTQMMFLPYQKAGTAVFFHEVLPPVAWTEFAQLPPGGGPRRNIGREPGRGHWGSLCAELPCLEASRG